MNNPTYIFTGTHIAEIAPEGRKYECSKMLLAELAERGILAGTSVEKPTDFLLSEPAHYQYADETKIKVGPIWALSIFETNPPFDNLYFINNAAQLAAILKSNEYKKPDLVNGEWPHRTVEELEQIKANPVALDDFFDRLKKHYGEFGPEQIITPSNYVPNKPALPHKNDWAIVAISFLAGIGIVAIAALILQVIFHIFTFTK